MCCVGYGNAIDGIARFWGAWGDLPHNEDVNVLALCVPRYDMPNATNDSNGGEYATMCNHLNFGGVIA